MSVYGGRFVCEKGCDLDEGVIVSFGSDGPEGGVIVYEDGTPSNRYGDGTVGVSDDEQEMATQETEGICANYDCRGYCTWVGDSVLAPA